MFQILSLVNVLGFTYAGYLLVRLSLDERPSYLDRHFFLSFVVIVFGILTQCYHLILDKGDWWIKGFSLISWINAVVFCNDIEKVDIKNRARSKQNKKAEGGSRLI